MTIFPSPMPTTTANRWQSILAVMLMALLLGKPAAGQQSKAVDFVRQVAPILQQRCLNCHGASKAEGGLRLHDAAATRRGGDSGAVLVPGKSGQSERFTSFITKSPAKADRSEGILHKSMRRIWNIILK